MRVLAVVVIAGTALTACQKPAPQAPPPSEVAVLTVQTKTLPEQVEFVGNVQAYRTVQVRAQATGVILQRLFTEGAQVAKGQVLYRIDPTLTEASNESARANLAQAEATLSNAETNAARLRPLLEGNAVAKQDVDNAETQVKQARANVDAARGALSGTRKNLSETFVRAEIPGRVGRALLDVGTRITGPGDVLTTVDMLDPVYVSFSPSAQQLFAWKRDPQASKIMTPNGGAKVDAILPDGKPFPRQGTIGYVDPVVDPQTGTQQFRAIFANSEHLMLPGQFVRVQVHGLIRENAIVIPQRAVMQQMGRSIVYVVGAGSKVEAREVTASDWGNGQSLIETGLKAGDQVIVDGLQKTGPGAPVKPVPFVDSTTAAAAPANAASPATSAAAPAKSSAASGNVGGNAAPAKSSATKGATK